MSFINNNLSGLAADPAAPTSGTIDMALQIVGKFLTNLGFTNDNGVIAARDKIANYVTQVLGNRDAAYKQLYTGYQLGHSDINNVGTQKYYDGVFKRLGEAAVNYIANHAQDSSAIFGATISPQKVLDRFTSYIQQGNKVDHAFWLAFTGSKDPFDLRTGASLPKEPTSSTNPIATVSQGYEVLRDAAGTVLQVKDAAGRLLNPGTAEYNAAVNNTHPEPQKAGVGWGLALVGAGIAAAAFAMRGSDNKEKK